MGGVEQKRRVLDWNICARCKQVVQLCKEDCPTVDVIVGILRGGGIPAVIVSHVLNVPLLWCAATSYNKEVQEELSFVNYSIVGNTVEGKHVIVCDDILDTGRTLLHVMNFVKSLGAARVTAFVLVAKDVQLAEDNDVGCVEVCSKDEWIVFPWETS